MIISLRSSDGGGLLRHQLAQRRYSPSWESWSSCFGSCFEAGRFENRRELHRWYRARILPQMPSFRKHRTTARYSLAGFANIGAGHACPVSKIPRQRLSRTELQSSDKRCRWRFIERFNRIRRLGAAPVVTLGTSISCVAQEVGSIGSIHHNRSPLSGDRQVRRR